MIKTDNSFQVYGTLVFQTGNSTKYILAGNIDISRIAYSSSASASGLTYCEGMDGDVGFSSLPGSVNVETFNFGTLIYTPTSHLKGYALPLVSFGKAYYHSSSLDYVGTWDDKTGIFSVGGAQYFLKCDNSSFAVRDENSVVLTECTYSESAHTITSGGSTYIYFASMYWSYSSGTATTSRLSSSSLSVSVSYNSTYERWLRA